MKHWVENQKIITGIDKDLRSFTHIADGQHICFSEVDPNQIKTIKTAIIRDSGYGKEDIKEIIDEINRIANLPENLKVEVIGHHYR